MRCEFCVILFIGRKNNMRIQNFKKWSLRNTLSACKFGITFAENSAELSVQSCRSVSRGKMKFRHESLKKNKIK